MKNKMRLILIMCLVSLTLGMGLNRSHTIQATTVVIDEEEVTQKLEDIDIQVSAILAELFLMEQVIQESKLKIIRIQEEMVVIQDRILEIEEEMMASRVQLSQYETTLGKVLATYQRMGATSFLEIVLESENIKNFLQRVTLFRDMTQGTGILIGQVEETLNTLALAEEQLRASEAALFEEEQALILAIEDSQRFIEEQELFLVSLEAQRAQYEAELNMLREAWIALKPIFKEASIGFSELASSGALTEDMIDVSLSLFGITATITEGNFNRAIGENPGLPSMIFSFENEGVGINMNQGVLQLMGYFEVRDHYELHYIATSGQFYGIDLEPSSIQELYEAGALILNVEVLTDGNRVRSIETKENEIILNIAFSIF